MIAWLQWFAVAIAFGALVAIAVLWARREKAPSKPPTYVTRQGVKVYGEPPDRLSVEDAIGRVQQWWSVRYPPQAGEIADRLRTVCLILVDSAEPLRDPKGRQCHGWSSSNYSYCWNTRDVVSVVEHEVGIHQMLWALDDHSTEARQHERAQREGFPYG